MEHPEQRGDGALRIQIILASNRAADREVLEDSFTGSPWRVAAASSMREVLQLLLHATTPIVICDTQFEKLPWQIVLRVLQRQRRRVSVILLADKGSAELTSELIQRGGFDLLSRPLRREEIFPTLVAAYAQSRISLPFARMTLRDGARTEA
jgi:DNA-binding NtrC family response regulator